MRILDRQRYWSFIKAYFTCYVSLVGLYIVIDAFSNLDEFMKRADGFVELIKVMGRYYLLHQALYFDQLGGVIGFDALFPGQSGTTADSVAWTLGGGMEMKYSRKLSFRLIEASFLNTRLPNNATSTQNNLKLSTGIVFHWK